MKQFAKRLFPIWAVALLVVGSLVAKETEEEPLVKAPPFNNRVGRARAAFKSGDNELAIKLYTEALGMRSSTKARRIAFIRRGNAYVDANRPDKGIADYNESLRLGACEACICLDRGLAYQQKGDIEKALADYARGIQADPGYADLYYNRASIYVDRGRIPASAL